MDWYYADGQEKRGPLPESELQALITAGTVKPETLVWNSTLPQWFPARDTTLFKTGVTATPGETQRCIITGQLYPTSQLIQTQHGWVSAEGKNVYYQSLREGAPIPTAPGVFNARCSGKRIVVPAGNPRLPLRCIKTNTPVVETDFKHKKLYWYPPLIALTILLNLLIFLVLYFVMRKKVEIDVPLSPAGRGLIRKHALIAWLMALGGIAAIVGGLFNMNFAWIIVVGFLLLLAGLIYGNLKATAMRVTKLKNGEAWLAGASPEFLASLPPYN